MKAKGMLMVAAIVLVLLVICVTGIVRVWDSNDIVWDSNDSMTTFGSIYEPLTITVNGPSFVWTQEIMHTKLTFSKPPAECFLYLSDEGVLTVELGGGATMNDAAEIFFNEHLKPMVGQYIKEKEQEKRCLKQ